NRLHTIRVHSESSGAPILNVPVVGANRSTQLVFDEAAEQLIGGVAVVDCAVHGPREARAYLGVAPHPFLSVVDENGGVRLRGVPARALSLTASRPSRDRIVKPLVLQPGGRAEVELRFATARPAD